MVVGVRQLGPVAGTASLSDDALNDDLPRTACVAGCVSGVHRAGAIDEEGSDSGKERTTAS
jgi:hypothetical protein